MDRNKWWGSPSRKEQTRGLRISPARPHASEKKLGGRCLEKPECGWRPGRMGTPRAQALPSQHPFLCTPLTQRGLQAGAKGQGLSPSLPGASVGNEDRKEGNREQEPQSGSSACFWKREERLARKGSGWIWECVASGPDTQHGMKRGLSAWGPCLPLPPREQSSAHPGPRSREAAPGSPGGPLLC